MNSTPLASIELLEVPSALEFMRYVSMNDLSSSRVLQSDWKATRTWDVQTLKELLDGQSVQVAVTPHGYCTKLFSQREKAKREQKRGFAYKE
jgi:hypothetical protein